MRNTSKLLIAVALLATISEFSHAAANIQHWRTVNGAGVYFIPAHELPIVDVQLSFDAGSARDGGKAGLARLTGALLENGDTATLSADAIAERLDSVGAQLDVDVTRDRTILSLRSLADAEYLTPALDIVNRLLQGPAFHAEALERERGRLLTAVKQRAQSPGVIAEEIFYQTLYGEHPYASPPDGTQAGLNAVTRSDVNAFHHSYYVAANAVIAIVGAIDRAGAEKIVTSVLAGVPAGKAAPALSKPAPAAGTNLVRIAHPSSQTHILMGALGIKRIHPDYYSLYLGNHALGGDGLVARLAEEVRQKRGLSYSVYSDLEPLQQTGPFLMGLQTRNDQVAEAVEVLRSTLQAFIGDGPSKDELEAARNNISGGFALRIDSNRKLVRYLGLIGFYGLPLDYLQTFADNIEAQSLEQVHKALQEHIQPEHLITVIVGGT